MLTLVWNDEISVKTLFLRKMTVPYSCTAASCQPSRMLLQGGTLDAEKEDLPTEILSGWQDATYSGNQLELARHP